MSTKTYTLYGPSKSSDFLANKDLPPNHLARRKSTYIYSTGDPKTAKYIIIGSQPSTQDVLNNRAFTGELGMELDNLLRNAKISKAECYITYVIKDLDRPEGFYFESQYKNKVLVNYKIHPEGQEYINLLSEELSNCASSTIITLGNLPLFILADRFPAHKWRSSVIDATLLVNKTIVPTLDPSSILYPQMQYKNKRLIVWDFKRAKLVAEGRFVRKKRNLIIKPSFETCLRFIRACVAYGKLNNPIGFDIETDVFNHEILCFSLAYNDENAICIPLIGPGGDYFTLPQEIKILKYLARLLEDPDIQIVGHNLSFDAQRMLRSYGICITNIQDTMIAQRTFLSEYPTGLDFVCSTYTDIPYYKDDGKYWLKGVGSFEQGWRYNALDAIVPVEALPKQLEALKKQRNYYTYERKRNSILPYLYMSEHGVRINLPTMQKAYDDRNRDAEKVLKELEDVAKQPLNPNSPKQVAAYFYDQKKLYTYKSKTGGRSTDEKAMKKISAKGFKEASLILKYRGLIKEASTFLDTEKIDQDSRIRSEYKPAGTKFSRAASSKSTYGTGNNFQNQPHDVLTHFEVDPLMVFYGLDLSQAENRLVARIGRIKQMIDAFEAGKDIHGLTAKIMIVIFYGPERARNISIHDKAPIGDGTKTWRDWGKKANHGLNYDLGYRNFSHSNEIPERDGKIIHGTYHRGYPGVREDFHTYIKHCINTTRTLTNYMGRKTYFADRISDQLYKQAYSCIPQGTVGDVIDQRGLNFIYYNTEPIFEFVELLIQIHDQIGFQIPSPYHPLHPYPWEDHVEVINKVKASLETPLRTHYGVKFVIPVDVTMGICLNKDFGRDIKIVNPRSLEAAYHELRYEHDVRTYYCLKED